MFPPEEVEYKVILLFPGYGSEREIAEDILEQALDHLNIPNYEPGWRFAPNVRAHLEIVSDVEDAQARLEDDDDLAMMFLHDLPEDERSWLTAACYAKGVPVCHTVDVDEPEPEEEEDEEAPPPRKRRREMQLVFKEVKDGTPRAHQLTARTLTAPPEGDEEELSFRFGQVIAVLALGVMEHHWNKQPTRFEGLGPVQ